MQSKRLRLPLPQFPPVAVPVPRPDRVEMVELVRRLDRERLPGWATGLLGGFYVVEIFRALALVLYPERGGTFAPSIGEIAQAAGCSRATTCLALVALRLLRLVDYGPRWRLVPAADGNGMQARRLPNGYAIAGRRDFAEAYESSRRILLAKGQDSNCFLGKPPSPGDLRAIIASAWEAPGASPEEEEIEIVTTDVRGRIVGQAAQEEEPPEAGAGTSLPVEDGGDPPPGRPIVAPGDGAASRHAPSPSLLYPASSETVSERDARLARQWAAKRAEDALRRAAASGRGIGARQAAGRLLGDPGRSPMAPGRRGGGDGPR